MHFSIDRTVHTTAFDKPVVDHWLERKIEAVFKTLRYRILIPEPTTQRIVFIYLFICLFVC